LYRFLIDRRRFLLALIVFYCFLSDRRRFRHRCYFSGSVSASMLFFRVRFSIDINCSACDFVRSVSLHTLRLIYVRYFRTSNRTPTTITVACTTIMTQPNCADRDN
jgi:hypothetical protein